MKWPSKQISMVLVWLLAFPVSFIFAQGMGSTGSPEGYNRFPKNSSPDREFYNPTYTIEGKIMRDDPPPTDLVQGGNIMEAPTNIEEPDTGITGGKVTDQGKARTIAEKNINYYEERLKTLKPHEERKREGLQKKLAEEKGKLDKLGELLDTVAPANKVKPPTEKEVASAETEYASEITFED